MSVQMQGLLSHPVTFRSKIQKQFGWNSSCPLLKENQGSRIMSRNRKRRKSEERAIIHRSRFQNQGGGGEDKP